MIRSYSVFVEGDKPYYVPQPEPSLKKARVETAVQVLKEVSLNVQETTTQKDEEVIKAFLLKERVLDLNSKRGKRYLRAAFDSSKNELLTVLVSKEKFQDGVTPLHMAIFWSELNAFLYLVKNGHYINSADSKGYTPLHCAVKKGKHNHVAALCRAGADVNAVTELKVTPLAIAVNRKFMLVVQRLLEHGADACCFDKNGRTPAFLAKMKGSYFFRLVRKNLYESPGAKALLKEQYLRMLLCHALSIKENASLISKQDHSVAPRHKGGFSGDYLAIEIKKGIRSFCECEGSALSDETKEFLNRAGEKLCASNQSAEELYAEWKEGKPIIVDTGFKSHYACVCFWKDTFILVNRGADDPDVEDHIFIGKFEEKRFSVATIEDIRKLDVKKLEDFVDYFDKRIERKLGLVYEESWLTRYLNKKIPIATTGNCTWSNREGMVTALSLIKAYDEMDGVSASFVKKSMKSAYNTTQDLWVSVQCRIVEKYLSLHAQPEHPYYPSPKLLHRACDQLLQASFETHMCTERVEAVMQAIATVMGPLYSVDMPGDAGAFWKGELCS